MQAPVQPAPLKLSFAGYPYTVRVRKFYVYLIAIALFGMAYPWLKTTPSGPLLIATAFAYFGLARLTSEKLGR